MRLCVKTQRAEPNNQLEKKEGFVQMIEETRSLCLPGFRVTLCLRRRKQDEFIHRVCLFLIPLSIIMGLWLRFACRVDSVC